jgi:hypothetical protein
MIKTREQYFEELQIVDGIFAEIGVFEGEFSEHIINTNKFSTVLLVDIFDGLAYSGDKHGENGKFIDVGESYNKLSEKYINDKRVHLIKNNSFDFLTSIPDHYLDVVYIDAEYTYENVKKELSLSRLKVKKDGIISGHDYNLNVYPDLSRAVDEFVELYNLSIEYTIEDRLSSYFIRNSF